MADGGQSFTEKYESRNPISRYLLRRFFGSLGGLTDIAAPRSVFEVGCGEGYIALYLAARGCAVQAGDIREDAVAEARQRVREAGFERQVSLDTLDIYKADLRGVSADLIVCCEVFEHLPDPMGALERIAQSPAPYLLASVPREPVWRLMNLCRLKYVASGGNTPGHINHWSKRGFVRFLSRHYEVLQVRTPLPWTMVLCRRLR